MGDSVTEGTVLEWHKQVGDSIEVDETLVEVSTDKIDAEVPSPVAGTITKILVEPDEVVAVGAVLAEVDTNGAAPAAPAAPEAQETKTVDLVLPAMGDSVQEGTILEWHKAVGDTVAVDETVVEVSTDKIDAEVPSPVAGTITEILAEPDQTVAIGAVMARIASGDVSDAGPGEAGSSAPPAAAPEPKPSEPSSSPAASKQVKANGATPVAVRMADANGVDIANVQGTGPRGRVTKTDVEGAMNGGSNDPRAASGAGPGEAGGSAAPAGAEPIRGPAATLAKFMNESRSIPTATSFRTLPVATLDARRRALKGAGKKLSFTHLIAWAIVQAAKDMPVMAYAYAEADGKPQRVVPEGMSIGLAVDAERKDGSRTLIVPVIHGAHAMSFDEFAAAYDERVAGARDNKLGADAYQGANITLTNPGGIGTVASVPRLMPGQGTIIATGAISYPPGFTEMDPDRLSSLGVSKVMTMTSTYDHRVIQGAESGAFLKRIDELLQGGEEFYETVFGALDLSEIEDGDAGGWVTAEDPVPSEVRPGTDQTGGEPDEALLQAVQAATSVVKAHRMHGHLAADLDPLGHEPPGDPALDPATVHLSAEQMAKIPASVLRVAVPGETFADALPHLQQTYCGKIAYEIEHISNHEQRVWLRQTIESGLHLDPFSEEQKVALLERLTAVEALESYLHKSFLGKKQFSIEGLDMLLPILDETVELAGSAGAKEVILGMAHRGRLNVLAHTVGRPYESILVEFEGESNLDADTALPTGGTGDVKYHHGARGSYKTRTDRKVTVTLSPNPSHLEYVNPVIEGRTRADQTSRKTRDFHHDPSLVVPVLIHGDAAFPGQGVVAETLNLQALEGYSTGGTIHIITNNQVGFTTEPDDARSTRYASVLAKGFDVPIIHVNADHVESCIAAIRLSMEFRERFGRDALIDLIGYRRFGHNETDEPAYTQPDMYARIKDHPPVRKQYADSLVTQGILSAEEAEAMAQKAYQDLADSHSELKASMGEPDTHEHELDRTASVEPRTMVGGETLRRLNERLIRVPEGFNLHRKLKPQLEKRRESVGEEGGIDWAQAEGLAFASLLCQGTPIRFTGQDSERGTFSQRHLVFHDSESGERYAPIQNLPDAEAPFELHNSPLSEVACMGFEYGYSAQAPETLVLWEAQFGDFVNSAQVIIDQFIVSGLAKWGQSTRLTLLLPHGYEGSGPEHSSGRLERFLALGAEGNIRVANCSTPAQYFHLLRRQALVQKARPLVVMTPKSLLRLPAATSRLEELSEGRFESVIDDPGLLGPREDVTKLILCSGKIYYDIAGSDLRPEHPEVGIARVELLYPFAENELRALMASYPNLREVMWVQEEPKNMGARAVMESRLLWVLPEGIHYSYEGRELRASPGEGYPALHRAEQSRIVRAALEGHE